VHLQEEGLLRGIEGSGGKPDLERSPGLLEHPRAGRALAGDEDLHEEGGFPRSELGGADGECGRHLLPGGQAPQFLGDAHSEEPGREEVPGFRGQAPSDLEPTLDPGFPPRQSAGHGAGCEPFLPVEVPEDLQLLAEARPAPGIVAAQALELGLGPRPGLHQDPGARGAAPAKSQVPLETVHQEHLASLFDPQERLFEVHLARS